jgi:hypothetical protein
MTHLPAVRAYAESVLAANPHAAARDHARAVLELVEAVERVSLVAGRWRDVVARCAGDLRPCSSCVARAQVVEEFREAFDATEGKR